MSDKQIRRAHARARRKGLRAEPSGATALTIHELIEDQGFLREHAIDPDADITVVSTGQGDGTLDIKRRWQDFYRKAKGPAAAIATTLLLTIGGITLHNHHDRQAEIRGALLSAAYAGQEMAGDTTDISDMGVDELSAYITGPLKKKIGGPVHYW